MPVRYLPDGGFNLKTGPDGEYRAFHSLLPCFAGFRAAAYLLHIRERANIWLLSQDRLATAQH